MHDAVSSDEATEDRYRSRLGELWSEVRSQHVASVDVILAHLGQRGSMEDAANAAHRLAGTLSIFELPTGAELAHDIEDALDRGDTVSTSDVERLRSLVSSHVLH